MISIRVISSPKNREEEEEEEKRKCKEVGVKSIITFKRQFK